MEDKKQKFKFIKNIIENYKNLDAEKKKVLTIVVIIIAIVVVISIVASIIVSISVGSADKIAGNLNNGGFAVGKGNKAYISNTLINSGENKDKGIYEINSKNESKLISSDEYVKSINKSNGYLYYLAINKVDSGNYVRQVVKMKPNGEKKQILVDNIETTFIGNDALNVSDGWVYYLNAEYKLEKVKTNGEKRQQISEEEIAYFQISGNYIYYVTRDDDFKRMKKDGASVEEIQKGIGNFQIVSNSVFYISNANKHLVKMNLKDKKEIEIVAKTVKNFNINGKNIYYACADEGDQAIYKVSIEGKKEKKVVELFSQNNYICVLGNWIYYTDKVENSPYYYTIYRVKTNGKNKEVVNF